MSSDKYINVLKSAQKLSSSCKRKLIIDISYMLCKDNSGYINIDRKCPHCGGGYIVKNGKNKQIQRYLCKSCKKSFVDATNTPIYNSKKSVLKWLEFLECLKKQYSVRKTAKLLNIATTTAFFWRHKILDAMRENDKTNILKEKIECEQVYLKESFKGNHKKEKFVMPTEPILRQDIETFFKIKRDKVCVLTALDSNQNFFVAPIATGIASSSDLIRSLGNKIEKNSLFIAKSMHSYKTFTSFCSLKFIELARAGYEKNGYSIERVQGVGHILKRFLKVYRGVATKYLSNYISLFNFNIKKRSEESPIYYKGKKPYLSMNFKGRSPIFE